MRNKKEVENTFEVTTKESIHFCTMGVIVKIFDVETQLKQKSRGTSLFFW